MKNKLIIIFLFTCIASNAQNLKYRNYKFEWPAEKPEKIEVADTFRNEDAVILKSKIIYNNKKPLLVVKHLRIKYLTQAGIDKHSKFVLPESFDWPSDQYSIRYDSRDTAFIPYGEFECMKYFAARILRMDGTIEKVIPEEKIVPTKMNGETRMLTFYNWIFSIPGIKPGDEIEVDYAYEGVFSISNSRRIFFNSVLPIQDLDFIFRFPDIEYCIITNHNGVVASDSIMITNTSPKNTEYHYHLKNLPGGINETGGRPYKEFQFITYYRHYWDFVMKDPNRIGVEYPLPYPWQYILQVYATYKWEDLKLKLSRMDNTTQECNRFTDELSSIAKDTSAASLLTALQHTLANDFDFVPDPEYYVEADDLEKLGKNIQNKKLQQMSRYRIYDEVILRTDKTFFKSVLMDKRLFMINPARYETVDNTRVGFASLHKDNFIHFYPKSYRFGYESNELPFYYEDIPVFLVPQNVEKDKQYDYYPKLDYRFISTPNSAISDNTRNTTCMVNVSLDSALLNMTAKIKLTGQFSTLTRGYYKYGSMDTTINTSYFCLINDIADNGKFEQTISSSSTVYPFETVINLKFNANNALSKKSDREYSIDLKSWFNNVTDNKFDARHRHLSYYPDFQSQDIHRYMLHFDHPVAILNENAFNKTFANEFGKYEFTVTQPSENDILFQSSLIVKAVSVPATKADDVATIFNFINHLQDAKLKIAMR